MKNSYYYSKLLFVFANIILFVSSCPFYPSPIKINQSDPLLLSTYSSIESYLDSKLQSLKISNFIITINYMDEIVWSKSYGNMNPIATSSPLTLDSTFRIASNTKLFTSLMMFQLRDKGLVRSLDDDVKNYFPNFSIKDIKKVNGTVTFRQLASHTSGLPRETPCESNQYGTVYCTEDIILDRLSNKYLLSDGYNKVHYSNVGFSLLGRTLGEIYKQSNTSNVLTPTTQRPQIYFENYIENQILNQLNMNSSKFLVNTNTLARAYYFDNLGVKRLVSNGLSGWNSPGGGLYSSARDMSKFIQFVLNGDENILSESTRNEFLTSVSLISNGNQTFGIPFEIFYDDTPNVWFKGKNGLLNGYRSQITLATELKLGIFAVSMTNAGGDLFTKDILKMLIPVYESLIYSQMEKVKNETQVIDQSFNSLIIGKYTDLSSHSFNVAYDNSSNLLYGYFDDTPNTFYSISNVANDPYHSHIKRINLLDQENASCGTIVNGPNDELIYFSCIDVSGSMECQGLDIMGHSMIKVI